MEAVWAFDCISICICIALTSYHVPSGATNGVFLTFLEIRQRTDQSKEPTEE